MSIMTTTARPAPIRTAPRVPWTTVAALAILTAFADGYWLISIRGAVGAIERSHGPFGSWWRESLLSVPLFALAVLAALTLGLRLFGPRLRSIRAVVTTFGLVVVAATVAGLAETIASSAYDYHLQVEQLRAMDAMRSICTGRCLAPQESATLHTHVRAILFAAKALAITNLVAGLWVVALFGGRLAVTATDRRRGRLSAQIVKWVARIDDRRLVVVAALVGSAAVHAAVVPEHLDEWPLAGAFFAALTIAQFGVAVAIAASVGGRFALPAAVLVSAGPLALWLVSRTVGLPFGPGAGVAESIGPADIVSGCLEMVSLAAALAVLAHRRGSVREHRTSPHRRALVVLTVVLVTVVGLSGAGATASWFAAATDATMSAP